MPGFSGGRAGSGASLGAAIGGPIRYPPGRLIFYLGNSRGWLAAPRSRPTCSRRENSYTPRAFGVRMSRDRNLMNPLLPPDYRPTEREPFMNPMQLAYFRQQAAR